MQITIHVVRAYVARAPPPASSHGARANPIIPEPPINTQTTSHPIAKNAARSEEHTSELQSLRQLVCRLLLENTILSSADMCELQPPRTVVCGLYGAPGG